MNTIKMTSQEWKDVITMQAAFFGMGLVFTCFGYWQVLALIAGLQVTLGLVLSAVWHLIE